jgi:hypothetical protein
VPRLRAFSVLLVAAVSGCGTRTELRVGGDDESAFAAELARTICATNAPCCATRPDPGCVTKIEAGLLDSASAARAAGATFDPAAATACLADLETAFRGCPTYKTYHGIQSCLRIYVGGRKANGDACSERHFFSGCATGLYCTTRIGATERKCEPLPKSVTVGAGELCGYSAEVNELRVCGAGFGCLEDLASKTQRCQLRPEAGEPCDGRTGDSCAEGQVCDRSLGGGRGFCATPLPEGAACTRIEQCESYSCNGGRCASRVTLGLVCE